MTQLTIILTSSLVGFIVALILKDIEVTDIRIENEMDRHHESMANLLKDGAKNETIMKQHRLIKLYENEIKRLEGLNDSMLNELKYRDIKK